MESKKVFLDSGWYVTGDIGQLIFKNGEERLIILGRKNTQQEELYVNHASVWVDVKALESSFLDIPIFQHVFLSGDRNRSYLVAVVVGVDIQLSSKFVDENELISQFERYAPQDAKPYEIPRAVVVVSKESWKRAVASTHSSKIQRLALKQHFSDEIAEAFARIESKESSVSTKHHNKIEDDETIKHIVETILKESLYDQNRKEQPQLHIPKDFVDFRFVLEDKKEEKALNHILNEAVVCVKIFRSSKSKWRRELLHMNRVKETRELEFQSKMNIFTKEIMKLSQALMKEVMEMLCSEVKKSTTTTWFKTFSKLRKLIKSRKMLAMQHQVRQSSFASSNHLKSDERSRIERDLNRATSRLSRLARLFKTNVPWQISSGAWLISSSSDAEPLLEQSMGEKRVYDYISSRCLETKFVSDRSKRIMRYRCLEAPEVCVDIHSMRFIRTLRAVSAILKSFDLYSKATLELNEFVTKLIPYGNLNYSFWIKEDLHPFHLRTEIMNVPTKFCTLSKKETSLMTQKMISVECIVENEKSRKIHVNDLVPNLSTISDLLSMVNEVEIDPDRHIYDTFTAKTMDMSAQISDSTKIILRKCENFKDEYTLVRIHHKGGTNEIVLRNAKYISAREVRRRIASVLNWKVESLDQVRLSTSLDLSKGIIDNQGLLGNYLEDNIKTGTITFWAKNMATITTASPTEKDTPARYLTRACAMFSARPALGTNRENEKNEIEALLSTSSHLERRSSFFYITYKDLHALAACVSVGLRRLLPFNNKRVGISGPNSIAWSIVDFACMLASRTSVGIHQTYDTKSVEHVLQNSNIGVLFLTSDQLFQSIKSKRWNGKSVLENSSTVNHLVLLDSDVITEDEEKKWISKHRGVSLWSLKDLMDDKEEQEQKQEQEQENSELTVLYTSGSSGRPKGVIVSSDTFLSDISEAIYTIPLVTCSYIPLSHSSDRMKLWKFLANGGRVGFVSYDPENWSEHEIAKKSELVGNFVSNQFNGVMQLFNQIRELSPSAMSCPPRIWNGLFNICLKEKEKRGEKEALKCVASMFGTRIKTIATGGGVTSLIVMDFAQRLANCCGAHFMESYGTTEVGAIAENSKPRPNVYVRLGKHHFGSSKACHNIGELEVKTETMSSGYLNNHKATKEAFLKDGYFRTGDLVRLHPKSKKIKILGRSSAAVVTKSGHVVFLARLESTYETRSKLIDRVLVVAQSDFDDVVAVVVPSISSKGEDDIRNDMMKIARELKLSDIEIPKRVHVSKMKWSVSNGLLAGNTKIMRKKLCSYYSNEIKRMWMSLKVLQK
jgi:long-chain acyl-CoA synthetase